MSRASRNLVRALVLILLAGGGCASRGSSEDGFVNVVGGRVRYHVVGKGSGVPLLVIHGGPGVPHQYLKSLGELGDERPVIFYDQLGCGESDRPANESLWIPRRFASEIDAIRTALGLPEVYLYADSWGAVVATEYMLSLPKGVRGVILSSPILSGPRYTADAERLLDDLPRDVRDTIRRHEADGTTSSEEYRQAYEEFFKQHICRRWSRPDELKDALKNVGPDVYRVMHGPNQIVLTGTLKDYDRTGEFWQMNVPIVILCGRHDVVTPETAAHYQSRMNQSRLVVFRESAHFPIYEEHEQYIEVIRSFLRDHEAH